MESLIAFQFAVALFCIFAITRTLLRVKDRQIGLGAMLFWMIVWLVVLILAFLPSFLTTIANTAGIGRGVDFVIYCSIGLLFYLVFRQYVQMRTLEQQLTQLTSTMAVELGKDKTKKK